MKLPPPPPPPQDSQASQDSRQGDGSSSNGGYPYYYTCQCPQGYGYENCTLPSGPGAADDADGSAGTTYCVTGEYTSIAAPTIVDEVCCSTLLQTPNQPPTVACKMHTTTAYPTNIASVNLVMGCSKVFFSPYSNTCPCVPNAM